MALCKSETLKYKMRVLYHFDEEESAISAYRHIGKRPMKAIIREFKLFFRSTIIVSRIYISLL